MVPPRPFYVGACVRTIERIAQLPIGTLGIMRTIVPVGDIYKVFFSAGIGHRIVHWGMIEPLRSSGCPPSQDST